MIAAATAAGGILGEREKRDQRQDRDRGDVDRGEPAADGLRVEREQLTHAERVRTAGAPPGAERGLRARVRGVLLVQDEPGARRAAVAASAGHRVRQVLQPVT